MVAGPRQVGQSILEADDPNTTISREWSKKKIFSLLNLYGQKKEPCILEVRGDGESQ